MRMRDGRGRYQVITVCAAMAVVLALAIGVASSSDAASPFDSYYGNNQNGNNQNQAPTLDKTGPKVPSKGSTKASRLSRSGVFAFAFGPFTEAVHGTVSFATTKAVAAKKHKLSFGTKKFSLKIGKRAKIRVKLSKRSRKAVRHYGKLKVNAKVVAKDFIGNTSKKTYTFTLKRPR
jgi:hypothetical protein